MKRNLLRLVLGIFLLHGLLLSGCHFVFAESDSGPQSSDFVNKDYLTFDDYNIVEVVVSDSERFILYDTKDDDSETGVGEWIKDGVSYPISFLNHDPNQKHGNIVITPNNYHNAYWDDSILDQMSPVIAMIHNDKNNPGLYYWVNGAYPYNWTFDEDKVYVKYLTYTRDDLSGSDYIPEKAMQFYSSGNSASFVSSELNLKFDGKTGKGIWTLNDTEIPIIASFDQRTFTFSVCYDTTDERDGITVFSANGECINSITKSAATFVLTSFPQNCNYDTISVITIEKISG